MRCEFRQECESGCLSLWHWRSYRRSGSDYQGSEGEGETHGQGSSRGGYDYKVTVSRGQPSGKCDGVLNAEPQ